MRGQTQRNARGYDCLYEEVVNMKKRTILLFALAAMAMIGAGSAAETVDQVEVRGTVVEVMGNNITPAGGWTASTSYAWNPYNFAAFWYDSDDDLKSEELYIAAIDNRTIAKDNLYYRTTPQWQTYAIVEDGVATRLGVVSGNSVTQYAIEGWMGEKYVAISKGGSCTAHGNKLSKLLVEFTSSNDKKTLSEGEAWNLGGGFTLNATQIDLDHGTVLFSFAKDGVELDDPVIVMHPFAEDRMYMYTTDLAGVRDVVLFSCCVDMTFMGADADMVRLKYVYLIDNNILNVRAGDKYGNMEVTAAGAGGITLKNDAAIDLSKDTTPAIMGGIYFRVADDDTVRFYPHRAYTEPGDYDVRGTIVEANATGQIYPAGGDPAAGTAGYTWDPYNFAAFYYDLDNDLKSEQLTIEELHSWDNRTIAKDKLVYSTTHVARTYPIVDDGVVSSLGTVSGNPVTQYFIEGWLAEKYVAISTGGSGMAYGNKLSKLLVEFDSSSDKKTLSTGESWDLGNGFTLNATEINLEANAVFLSLAKNGMLLDDSVIDTGAGGDRRYMYTENVSGVNDVAIFSCYVDAVFRGTDSNLVQLKYVFLIDNEPLEVHTDDRYGNTKVTSAGSSGITLKNDGAIDLSKKTDAEITEDMYFKVADSNTVRFYPCVKRTIGGEEPTPPATIPANDTDGDGVPDVWDADNSTQEGYWVNPHGIGRMWGDMNGDGRLTSVDALMILQAATGKIDL